MIRRLYEDDPSTFPTLTTVTARADELVAAGMSRGEALIQSRDEARAVIAALDGEAADPGPLPPVVEPDGPVAETGGLAVVPISAATVVQVGSEPGSDRTWLTLRHHSTAVTVVMTVDQTDRVCEALAAACPAPWLPELPPVDVIPPAAAQLDSDGLIREVARRVAAGELSNSDRVVLHTITRPYEWGPAGPPLQVVPRQAGSDRYERETEPNEGGGRRAGVRYGAVIDDEGQVVLGPDLDVPRQVTS